MIKYCSGCGIKLQTQSEEEDGYTVNINNDLCKRCFRLKHYGEYELTTKSQEEFRTITKEIGKKRSLVLYVVDILSIPQNIIEIKKDLVNNDVILVLNKKDVLPSSVTDSKILEYFNTIGEEVFIDKIVISASKGYNIGTLAKLIKDYRKYKEVFIVGSTNAGKSTLINELIDYYKVDENEITISNMPNTTLEEIKIPVKNFYLVDTPGLVDERNILNRLDDTAIKKLVSKKAIKPKTYQIKKGQAILVEDFLRIDYKEGERNSFTVFMSNNLNIRRINGKRHNNLKELGVNEIELGYHEDIVINGLGFVKTILAGKVDVYVDKDVEVFKRKSLI